MSTDIIATMKCLETGDKVEIYYDSVMQYYEYSLNGQPRQPVPEDLRDLEPKQCGAEILRRQPAYYASYGANIPQ